MNKAFHVKSKLNWNCLLSFRTKITSIVGGTNENWININFKANKPLFKLKLCFFQISKDLSACFIKFCHSIKTSNLKTLCYSALMSFIHSEMDKSEPTGRVGSIEGCMNIDLMRSLVKQYSELVNIMFSVLQLLVICYCRLVCS